MASLDEIRNERIKKLETLRKAGLDPYPAKTTRTHQISEVLEEFDNLKETTIAGRMMSKRAFGGSIFSDLNDGTGKIQVYLKKDNLRESFSLFEANLDIGDFLEVSGTPFTTKKGEKSILVTEWKILTKSLRPLPEKWHGLQDVEVKFRQRYLDFIMNDEAKKKLITRTKMISAIRKFFDERNFLEIETPTLQPIHGGALAKPFKTHHNELDHDFYLRISDEMYLKRALVGGIEKVYEITKVFRNEGMDHNHNPEFTMLEAQIAYQDYEYGMDLIEEIIESTALKTLGTTKLPFGDHIIDVKRPWKRLKVVEAIKEITGEDPLKWRNIEEAKEAIQKMDIRKEKLDDIDELNSVGELIAFAFEETVEEKLIQPTIIYDYPVEVSPLAKKTKDERFTQRFEYFAFGSELGNNYSELNDPIDLKKRFIEEGKKTGEEAHQTDEDYLIAIEHGFPPSFGLSIGIDRLAMLFTNSQSIKEIIMFPTMRPKK